MANLSQKELPTEFYSPQNFFSLNGAALAVWIFCLVIGAIFPPKYITPLQYRIVALILSELIAIIIVYRFKNRKPEYWFLAFFNGLLIFVNASGWNVITSNTFFSDRNDILGQSKKSVTNSAFFDFRQTNWWEDNSLFIAHKNLIKKYDSLINVTAFYQSEVKKYVDMDTSSVSLGPRVQFHIDSLKQELLKRDSEYIRLNLQHSGIVLKDGASFHPGMYAFLDKMNILYLGVDNPITVFSENHNDKIIVTFKLGKSSFTGIPGHYILRPERFGLDTISISINGKLFKYPVRVKPLPEPTVFVGKVNGGAISSAEFKVLGGIHVQLPNTEFDASFQVLSYKLGAVGGPINNYVEAANAGSNWSGSALTIVSVARVGTSIFFYDIKVKGPDGIERDISPMAFTLY